MGTDKNCLIESESMIFPPYHSASCPFCGVLPTTETWSKKSDFKRERPRNLACRVCAVLISKFEKFQFWTTTTSSK